MNSHSDHLILNSNSIRDALGQIDTLGKRGTLFVVNDVNSLLGTVTDGDIRRHLLKGGEVQDNISSCMNKEPLTVSSNDTYLNSLKKIREKGLSIIPMVNALGEVVDMLDLLNYRSRLPIDAVIMAGGKGVRLRPLTEKTPKPLLYIGDKPIMKHNMDRLKSYGIKNFWVSINYLGGQIVEFFGDGTGENISITYLSESHPLGTIGSASLVPEFMNEDVLVTNSDLLTTLDYEQFYLDFKNENADMSVLSIPHEHKIPFAVMNTEGKNVLSFEEKPTYAHFTNGGVYLIKRELLYGLEKNQYFDATDLMQKVIDRGKKLIHYVSPDYWLDVGSHEDFKKAKRDIEILNL
ncbi:MAG: nucleotidyltransferase family protein [Bacteroidetes bacterium]|nr:nucleotidyltransferase family protein [Bacteroidota bacterium]